MMNEKTRAPAEQIERPTTWSLTTLIESSFVTGSKLSAAASHPESAANNRPQPSARPLKASRSGRNRRQEL
jgi:hypothetical protein